MNNDPLKGLRGEAETIAALELENQSLTRRLEEAEENLENSRILQREHLANSIAKGKQLTALRTAAEGMKKQMEKIICRSRGYQKRSGTFGAFPHFKDSELDEFETALAALRAELDHPASNASNSPTASRESQG